VDPDEFDDAPAGGTHAARVELGEDRTMGSTRSTTLLPAVAILLFWAQPVPAAPESGGKIDALCKRHETQIGTLLGADRHVDAILQVIRYERDLISSYPPWALKGVIFQSVAHHLTFRVPSREWLPPAGGHPEWSTALIFQRLLVLERKGVTLVAVSMDHPPDGGAPGEDFTMAELKTALKILADKLGTVTKAAWQEVGSLRAFVMEMSQEKAPATSLAAIVTAGNRLFIFCLHAPVGAPDLTRTLTGILESIRLNYRPRNAVAIESLRTRLGGESPGAILRCVGALAREREFGAAAETLARLRARLPASIPDPRIEAGVGLLPAYGLTLTVPDPARWSISTETSDGIPSFQLRAAKGGGQMYVAVLDLAASYGPKILRILPEEADELRRYTLKGAGQGSILGMGGTIRSERFRTVGGLLAYEAIADAREGAIRVKSVSILRGCRGILAVAAGPTAEFAKIEKEFETVLEKHLRIAPAGK
jgi:hypothetical protein